MAADYSSFFILLIAVPEEIECYETSLILNYFGFPFSIEEDNILKPEIKKEMGFKKEDKVSVVCNYHILVPIDVD